MAEALKSKRYSQRLGSPVVGNIASNIFCEMVTKRTLDDYKMRIGQNGKTYRDKRS
jgi:hypothetical protein